ncbi:penicillin-binding protein activator [Methylopila sp. Yamaguchi]|uniref:penicillin-binding protein activator n=1 Tax=Methylopila sp. Yamaguchi TaxID=1437817 RepID=UPI000CC115C7|nr:penicillin-binding protein activator [Methylopila sp. Yamaguchi]GBD47751.1 extracellular ligand-binding receptor [Methylopila sp. Yamaguchi]
MTVDPRSLAKGWRALLVGSAALALAACGGGSDLGGTDERLNPLPGNPTPQVEAQPLGQAIGQGSTKVALVLPLSASGNAGAAAQSMKNAAELALSEFNSPDIQLVVKDDGGTAQGAQAAVNSATDEGARMVIGPLFAHSVQGAGQAARQKGVPVVAFSTDANVASRGVYLLSFLPESDVDRIVRYAVSQGKRSFAALLPENGYGTVVEGAFQQAVARAGGRVVALERYPTDKGKMAEPIARVANALGQADALFIPDTADSVPTVVGLLAANGVNLKRVQLLGTGLWDDPQMGRDASLAGAWYAAPDSSGFRSFAQRYKAKFGSEPTRTASLAYDATSLVAALVKTQGAAGLTDQTFANPSGFAGVDGTFRFRADGGNDRALAVYQVQPGGAKVISPAPRSFDGQTAQAN